MKAVMCSLSALVALSACAPQSEMMADSPEPPVSVTAVHRGLVMTTVLDAETGLLAQQRASLSNPYHIGDLSIVTRADGSVAARTAYVEDFPGAAAYNAPPVAGAAVMNGSYRILSTQDIARNDGVTTYDTTTLEGPITVNVDFATGAVTASSADLNVAASLTGTTLAGTATHNGVTGALTGNAGRDPILTRDFIFGLFQGANADQGKAFAGGIEAHSNF